MTNIDNTTPDTQPAEIIWDDQGQPLSKAFGDIYFSRVNGLEETRHVFLQHNNLAQRWLALENTPTFTIGETGFGSGLNFLAAWQLWSQIAPTDAHLHFVSVEKYPLSKSDLIRALSLWPELKEFSDTLVDQYPVFIGAGFHRLKFTKDRIDLTLIIDDAAQGLTQLTGSAHPLFTGTCAKIDAWFLDGFAPSKNPQMWSDALFDVIGKLSHSATTAATFSAAAIVKQGLIRAGYTVKKVPGFGRKREMVAAVYSAPVVNLDPKDFLHRQSYSRFPTPWAVNTNPAAQIQHAIVIGAGLAGCHTARALAEKNWRVTLVERHPTIADGASGNPQGVLYAKLSPKHEAQAAFNLASLQFALRHYQSSWGACDKDTGELIANKCGVLQLAHKKIEAQRQELLKSLFIHANDFVQFVDAQKASELSGIELQQQGIFFPAAGWINPRLLCKQLIQHSNITVESTYDVLSLALENNYWKIIGKNQEQIFSAPTVIVANAGDAQQFPQCAHLPLNVIRGQVSFLPAKEQSEKLKTVICNDGYIGPAYQTNTGSVHCVGATFNLKSTTVTLRAEDHETNLKNLQEYVPELGSLWNNIDPAQVDGRVAFRCATPDYLPLVGPAPDITAFIDSFSPLRKNARAGIPQAGTYYPGLYLNLGHGSRGLAYTPLCAELLAAQICKEILPLPRNLADTLNPARFIIRDLIRNNL